jgi:hypothetical protein
MEPGDHKEYYVCDYINEDTPEAKEINELGLTLRARLNRSRGEYAMLEGTIFNPTRLLDSIIKLTAFDVEKFTGSEYRDGHAILKVEADGCLNKYLIYGSYTLDKLTDRLKKMKG